MKNHATLKKIRLELARTEGFPEGSPRHGYEFVAPLDNSGHIDADAWHDMKDRCTVLRFWSGQDDEAGRLRHVGHGWRFDYDGRIDEDDEPFFKLDRHTLAPGKYVSITEHDRVQRPFRVVSVTPFGGTS